MSEIILGILIFLIFVIVFFGKRFSEYREYMNKVFLLCQEWNSKHIEAITLQEEDNAFDWCYNKVSPFKSIALHNKELTHELMLPTDVQRRLGMKLPLEKWSYVELQEELQRAKDAEEFERAAEVRDILNKQMALEEK